MNRELKAQQIEELTGKVNSTQHFYITDASGLTVDQVNGFRRKCFEGGLEYRVYKNTVIKKAFENSEFDYSAADEALKGFSGIIFSGESSSAPAKLLKDFRKSSEKPLLKAAIIDSDVIGLGDEQLEMLSKLKSKEELIGEIIGLLQSPVSNVMGALSSGGSKLSGILQTLSDKAE